MAETLLLIIWLSSALFIWLLTFGYVLALEIAVLLKPKAVSSSAIFPSIAVVVPTLDEETAILPKLKSLRSCLYPQDKIRWVVVDGGSKDRTLEILKREISMGSVFQLIDLPEAKSKADQILHILNTIEEEIIVFTDADSRLDPDCIRELVQTLNDDSRIALAAACVQPESRLLEERIHWWFLNHVWWLEGEALSCSGLSGVCFAVSRKAQLALASDARAEDIQLGLKSCMNGFKVKLVRTALAYELRVPQTVRDFLRFRQRRGSYYLSEFLPWKKPAKFSGGWKLARYIRLGQILGVPWLAGAILLSGGLLLMTQHWMCVLGSLLFFGASILSMTIRLSRRAGERVAWLRLVAGTARFALLLLFSLFILRRDLPQKRSEGECVWKEVRFSG